MITQKQNPIVRARLQSELAAADEIPNALEAELHRCTVPAESRGTPRGEFPSRKTENAKNRIRTMSAKPFAILYRVMRFRVRRGEPVDQVTAPLSMLRAALSDSGDVDMMTLVTRDMELEKESQLAALRFAHEPTTANAMHLAQCEAREDFSSQQIQACAIRLAGAR
jgi:hypothetical protein